VAQYHLAKWANADLIVYVGCDMHQMDVMRQDRYPARHSPHIALDVLPAGRVQDDSLSLSPTIGFKGLPTSAAPSHSTASATACS
jgi:vacuolar-type H+-ATPase catalytic subunit A/Vma1